MGKRIISQARGKGSLSYRVRRAAYKYKPKYPIKMSDEYEIVSFVTEAGHSAPIAKMKNKKGFVVYNLAANGVYVGQKIKLNGKNKGDISELGNLENSTKIFNIELRPNDGGKLIKTSGNSAVVLNSNFEGKVKILLPSKKEKLLEKSCRATVGEVAGQGRLDKPILKAGKNHFIKKSRNKLWPRTSAVKMNAIDHPFGSGRGKRPKPKIIKRFASPGQKVGHLKPRKTGGKR